VFQVRKQLAAIATEMVDEADEPPLDQQICRYRAEIR
jgi:hypothetical protein